MADDKTNKDKAASDHSISSGVIDDAWGDLLDGAPGPVPTPTTVVPVLSSRASSSVNPLSAPHLPAVPGVIPTPPPLARPPSSEEMLADGSFSRAQPKSETETETESNVDEETPGGEQVSDGARPGSDADVGGPEKTSSRDATGGSEVGGSSTGSDREDEDGSSSQLRALDIEPSGRPPVGKSRGIGPVFVVGSLVALGVAMVMFLVPPADDRASVTVKASSEPGMRAPVKDSRNSLPTENRPRVGNPAAVNVTAEQAGEDSRSGERRIVEVAQVGLIERAGETERIGETGETEQVGDTGGDVGDTGGAATSPVVDSTADEAAAYLKLARVALAGGDNTKAYRSAYRSQRIERSSASRRLMGIAACRMKNRPMAQATLRGMRSSKVEQVVFECKKVGITLDAGGTE